MPLFSTESAEAQWIAQLTAMRAALAGLKLPPQTDLQGEPYGENLDFDDDAIISEDSGDDIWGFISDSDEDYYISDLVDGADLIGGAGVDVYGPQWLKSKCMLFAGRMQGLSSDDLQEQIMTLLSSDIVEEELQSTLTDIIGFDDLDFVIDLISHRKDLASFSSFSANTSNGVIGRLHTKEQREETLRQRDFEHKNAPLGPSLHKDAPNYPHVYKAHSAGNILAANGRKYTVPFGSERKDRDVRTLHVIYHCHNVK
jgi:antiviral helicase SLH1